MLFAKKNSTNIIFLLFLSASVCSWKCTEVVSTDDERGGFNQFILSSYGSVAKVVDHGNDTEHKYIKGDYLPEFMGIEGKNTARVMRYLNTHQNTIDYVQSRFEVLNRLYSAAPKYFAQPIACFYVFDNSRNHNGVYLVVSSCSDSDVCDIQGNDASEATKHHWRSLWMRSQGQLAFLLSQVHNNKFALSEFNENLLFLDEDLTSPMLLQGDQIRQIGNPDVRLSDFRFADFQKLQMSPAYSGNGQANRDTAAPAADIWALAVIYLMNLGALEDINDLAAGNEYNNAVDIVNYVRKQGLIMNDNFDLPEFDYHKLSNGSETNTLTRMPYDENRNHESFVTVFNKVSLRMLMDKMLKLNRAERTISARTVAGFFACITAFEAAFVEEFHYVSFFYRALSLLDTVLQQSETNPAFDAAVDRLINKTIRTSKAKFLSSGYADKLAHELNKVYTAAYDSLSLTLGRWTQEANKGLIEDLLNPERIANFMTGGKIQEQKLLL